MMLQVSFDGGKKVCSSGACYASSRFLEQTSCLTLLYADLSESLSFFSFFHAHTISLRKKHARKWQENWARISLLQNMSCYFAVLLKKDLAKQFCLIFPRCIIEIDCNYISSNMKWIWNAVAQQLLFTNLLFCSAVSQWIRVSCISVAAAAEAAVN